jgi:hypothetical protein
MELNWKDIERIIRENPDPGEIGKACPTPEELARLVEGKARRGARNKILKHVANCPDCAQIIKSLLSLSREIDILTGEPEVVPRPRFFLGRRLAITALATMVGITILAISITRFSKTYTLRGRTGGIELISPERGALLEAGRIQFEWKAVPEASRYFVEIFGGSLELVWRSESLYRPQAEMPEGTAAAIRKGETYFWRVTAVLASGREIFSKTAKFSIR